MGAFNLPTKRTEHVHFAEKAELTSSEGDISSRDDVKMD